MDAQQSLESTYRISGEGVTSAFEEQREVIQKSSAVIYNGREEIAYGVVVSPDGYILTKASEVQEINDLDARVDREYFKSVKLVMVDPRWDVALLKVDGKGLVPVEYASTGEIPQGTWVVVNGATSRTKRRVLAGIISARPREILPEGGAVLGVQLEEEGEEVEVKEVTEGSGAEDAGVKAGDVVLAVGGIPVMEVEDLTAALEDKKAGEKIKVALKRGEETLELSVRLAARGELFAEVTRNDQMSGDYSKRRSGFPRIIQHDILANSHTMGGPVIDLDGRMVGMNIARANRAETFAIPVEEVRKLAKGMIAQAAE
ncbi:trypsin-like peptidase domain-containing protein [Luteolibacter algae]|uniref:trypsin-like peptidase domain-containing protein n=1 Tax=Luteolibacter algae TaxID=454151 RepID=UPI0036DC7A58